MTPDACYALMGSCMAVGALVGAVICIANSWRV